MGSIAIKISPCAVFTTNESLLPLAKTARSRSGCGGTDSEEPLKARPLASRTAIHQNLIAPLALVQFVLQPFVGIKALPAQFMLQRRGLLDCLQRALIAG